MKNEHDHLTLFNNSILPSISENWEAVLRSDVASLENVIQSCTDRLSEGRLAEAVQEISNLEKELSHSYVSKFNELLERETDQAELTIELPQVDRHFANLPEDSVVIKLGKGVKRIQRGVSKAWLGTTNGVRGVFKKEKKSYQVPSRTIPLRNTIRQVYLNNPDIFLGWENARSATIYHTIQILEAELINQLSFSESTFEGAIAALENQQKVMKDLVDSALRKSDAITERIAEEWGHIIERVGTVELSASAFYDVAVQKKKESVLQKNNQQQQVWQDLVSIQTTQLRHVAKLIDLKTALMSGESQLTSEFVEFVDQRVAQPHEKLVAEVSVWFNKLKNIKKEDAAFSLSEAYETQVQDIVNQQIITPLKEAVESLRFSTRLTGFVSSLSQFADSHAEKIQLINIEGIKGELPEYDLKEINWQSFLRRLLGELLASNLLPEVIRPEEKFQDLVDEYTQLLQIVETNLDVADEVDRKEKLDASEVMLNGVELALKKLEEIQQQIDELRVSVEQAGRQALGEFLMKIHELMKNQDVGEMKWADTQLKVKKSAGDYGAKASILWAKVVERLVIWRRFLGNKLSTGRRWAEQFLGLTEAEHINVQKTNIATLLHETELKFQQLPFIYRRLFDFKREVEASFFVKNPITFETTQRAFELWKTGFPASVAIVGEKGSGKTTLIKYLKKDIFGNHALEEITIHGTMSRPEDVLELLARSLKIDKCETAQDLVQAINRRRKPVVVVIENLQNVFIRHINGYNGLNALLYVMAETRHKVFWMVSVSRYAWGFLDVVSKVSDYFSHALQVDAHSTESIEQLVLKRQKASGYQMLFNADPSTSKSRAYQRTLDNPEEEQKFLQEKFFERLHKIAEGNATVAMIYWIRSIVSVEESHVVLEPVDISGIDYLQEMDAQSLFTLSAFILHDTLTAEELAIIMNTKKDAAQLMISRFGARGLLVKKNGGFCLNDMIYRQVVRLLKSRNIINV